MGSSGSELSSPPSSLASDSPREIRPSEELSEASRRQSALLQHELLLRSIQDDLDDSPERGSVKPKTSNDHLVQSFVESRSLSLTLERASKGSEQSDRLSTIETGNGSKRRNSLDVDAKSVDNLLNLSTDTVLGRSQEESDDSSDEDGFRRAHGGVDGTESNQVG